MSTVPTLPGTYTWYYYLGIHISCLLLAILTIHCVIDTLAADVAGVDRSNAEEAVRRGPMNGRSPSVAAHYGLAADTNTIEPLCKFPRDLHIQILEHLLDLYLFIFFGFQLCICCPNWEVHIDKPSR